MDKVTVRIPTDEDDYYPTEHPDDYEDWDDMDDDTDKEEQEDDWEDDWDDSGLDWEDIDENDLTNYEPKN